MKLNKNGWGTLEMVLLSIGLLIALLIAIFFISRLYGSLENSIGKKEYMNLESKLEEAAKDYVNQNNIIIESELRVSYDTLKAENFIDNLQDKKGRSCSGYVIINHVENNNLYHAYISCNDYKTVNY